MISKIKTAALLSFFLTTPLWGADKFHFLGWATYYSLLHPDKTFCPIPIQPPQKEKEPRRKYIRAAYPTRECKPLVLYGHINLAYDPSTAPDTPEEP